MNVPSWIYDSWFIALATLILTLVAEPSLSLLVSKVRSLFGDFSGTYLAITVKSSNAIFLEIVECQHIGSRLKGKIYGVCVAKFKDNKLVERKQDKSHYRFSGVVDERLFLLSFRTTKKGARGSGGTLTLIGDGTGKRFRGRSAGFIDIDIVHSPCIWTKLEDKPNSSILCETLIKEAEKTLIWYNSFLYSLQVMPEELVVKPSFGVPQQPAKITDLFVLMPFDIDLKPVYSDHITGVAKKLGITVARADDFFTTQSVMSDIWSAICTAHIIIADCTGRNPNVFYEIGLAHVVGKPVVLITQNSDDIPFDIRHIRYIQYKFTPQGMKLFEQKLEETLRTLGIKEPHNN